MRYLKQKKNGLKKKAKLQRSQVKKNLKKDQIPNDQSPTQVPIDSDRNTETEKQIISPKTPVTKTNLVVRPIPPAPVNFIIEKQHTAYQQQLEQIKVKQQQPLKKRGKIEIRQVKIQKSQQKKEKIQNFLYDAKAKKSAKESKNKSKATFKKPKQELQDILINLFQKLTQLPNQLQVRKLCSQKFKDQCFFSFFAQKSNDVYIIYLDEKVKLQKVQQILFLNDLPKGFVSRDEGVNGVKRVGKSICQGKINRDVRLLGYIVKQSKKLNVIYFDKIGNHQQALRFIADNKKRQAKKSHLNKIRVQLNI